MSQKTILSFFKQVDSSSNKIKADKSSSNDDIKKQTKSSDVKEVESSNNSDTEKKVKSLDVKIDKSDTNNGTKTKPKLNGDSGNLGNCVGDDVEKSSTKKGGRKSDSKKKSPVTKKLPAKRNSKTLSSPKSPIKFPVKDDKSKVIGNCENSIRDCFNDSPVKQPKKRKRIQQICDSDENSKDSEEEQKEKSKSCDEEMEVDDESPNGADTEIVNNAENLSETPTKKSPEQPAKRRKTSQTKINGDEDLSANSVIKKESNDSTISEKNSEENLSENSDAIQENDSCTPKTKTAQKQVSGGKKKKESQPKASNSVQKEESIEELKDSIISKKNFASSSENSGANQESDSCIPKRKTARKQISGGRQKKESQPKTSNSDQKENEASIKSSLSPEKKAEDHKAENEKSPEKTKEIVEKNSKSDVEESKSEEPDKESKKDEKKENSESKKAIHPFFGKMKEPSASSSEEKVSKKDVKCSSSTGTSYDPSKTKYHPIDDACWKKGEKTPYLALAKALEIIENTSARLKIVEILSNYLRSVIVLSPEDLLYSVYLCLNRLAPEYEGIELGVGDMLLMKAVAQATGRTVDKIKAEVVVKGDLGLVAESSRGNQRVMFAPPKLTVSSVFSKFKEIAKMSGNAAMGKKVDKIQLLFVACRECEARFIIRSLSGKLRIGLAEQSVLAALARAAVLTPPNQSYPPEIIDKSTKMSADSFKEFLQEQTLILKTTYCECPNFDVVIPVLLKEGIAGLPTHCQLQPGCPLKPMLAHPTNGIKEVLNRFDKNEFTCEYKYDGERAQIHRTDKGEVKIFSRNQEDNTSKYPDIISRLPKVLKESTTSFILDTEAVAWDSETKQILPFQVLSTRKKKDAVESDIVVQVCIMAFDLLYLNGESLVKKPLKERRELLHSSFVEVENEFMFVKYRDGDNAETMQEFLDESVKGNCEGLMVKALTVDASYEIAKRSHNWLKLKKDYLNGIGDTLDLLVIGGYHGKGKRKGFYGGFLLACYDDDNEEFQSICKLGTGFNDKELETHTEFFKNHVIDEPKSYYRYDSSLEPDVWFDAVQIWEIKCADLSISPVHKAAIGIVDPEKGISLRFPRFLRIREDKSKPEDATVASRIAELYQKQEQVQNTKSKNMKSEEDYY